MLGHNKDDKNPIQPEQQLFKKKILIDEEELEFQHLMQEQELEQNREAAERSSVFPRLTFVNIWGATVFIFNIYTINSAAFWAGAQGFPANADLFIELTIELILFFEIIARIILRKWFSDSYVKFKLIHAESTDTMKWLCFILVVSFPIYCVIIIALGYDTASSSYGIQNYFLLIKLCRGFEITRAFRKLRENLFFRNFSSIVILKTIQNIAIIIYLTHIASIGWLILEKQLETADYTNYYFNYTGEQDADIVYKYVDAIHGASADMGGTPLGSYFPLNFAENIGSALIFILGQVIQAKIFGDFDRLLALFDEENLKSRINLLQTTKFCHARHVPSRTREKIRMYYSLSHEIAMPYRYHHFLQSLPISLQTELSLILNKEMLTKVNIFNLGSPSIVLFLARHFKPQICMPGDLIVRYGDLADCMYFVRSGQVEILATDEKTRIAVLTQGAYFGEIGLMLTDRRTVSVRALTLCRLEVLEKDKFMMVAKSFPEIFKFLRKIAKQRIKDLRGMSESPLIKTAKKHQSTENLTLRSNTVLNKAENPDYS